MRRTYGERLGGHTPSASGEDWFTKKFAKVAGDQLKQDDGAWMKYGSTMRRLLRIASELSVARVELATNSKSTELTGTDMWYGLYAVRWAACPDIELTGRWCNFLEDGPPEGRPPKSRKPKTATNSRKRAKRKA